MKKIWLKIGLMASLAAPITTIISCSSKNNEGSSSSEGAKNNQGSSSSQDNSGSSSSQDNSGSLSSEDNSGSLSSEDNSGSSSSEDDSGSSSSEDNSGSSSPQDDSGSSSSEDNSGSSSSQDDSGSSSSQDDSGSSSSEGSQNNDEGIKINKQKSFHNNYVAISLDKNNYRLLNNPAKKLKKPKNSKLLKLFMFSGKGRIKLKDKSTSFENQMKSQGFVEYTLINNVLNKPLETKTLKLYKDITYFFKIGDLAKMNLDEVEKIVLNSQNMNKSQVISYIDTLNIKEKNKKILIAWINECSDNETWIKAKHILKFAIASLNMETIKNAITSLSFLVSAAYLVETEIDWPNILTNEEKEYIKTEGLNANKYTNLRQLIYSGNMNINEIAKSIANKFSSNADSSTWNKTAISYVGQINGDTFTRGTFWSYAEGKIGGEETIKYILTNSVYKYKFV